MTRIIAGRAGGRRLSTPPGDGTRPTTDRVREAFFSAIAAWNGSADRGADGQLAGLGFCDLYAGSGAMALEAASRGASPVLACESDARVAEVVRRNVAATGLAVEVRTMPVATLVAAVPPQPFDVVWLDPPYATPAEQLAPVLERLVSGGWVAANGVVVMERSSRGAAPDVPGCEQWTRAYGDTTLHWYAPTEGEEQS